MQISFAQLDAHLKKGLHAAYVLQGDEPLQALEAGDHIRSVARAQGFAERSVHTVLNVQQFDWGDVLNAGSSMSLFGDRQVLEIRIPGGKPGNDGAQALQQLAEQQAGGDAGILLMVTLPKLDKTTQSSAWYTALQAQACVIRCDPIERSALPAWLSQRLSRQGQRVADGEAGERTLAFFADRVEGNLLAAHQELQKLALLYPAGELSFEAIEAAVLDVARYELSGLSQAVLAGQMDRAQRILDGLEAEGEAAVLVFNTLAGDVRALARACTAMTDGEPMPIALRSAGVWGERQRALERILPRVNRASIVRLLIDAHRVDGIVKGLRVPDWPTGAWPALHRFSARLGSVVRTALAR